MAGCGLPSDGPGPWHLDLRAVLAEQAARLGIGGSRVSSHCSAHDRPTFYSHRASKGVRRPDGGVPRDARAESEFGRYLTLTLH